MFKRLTWMGIGMAVGATGAFRAKRKLEETVERYLPEQVADRAVTSARGLGQTVRAAASEGREAMRATEAELRARVEARTFVGDRAPTTPAVDAVPAAAPAAPGVGRSGARRASRPSRPRADHPGARRRPRR